MDKDYECALHYMLQGKWDDLFTLMIRTNDDFLCKKIHSFLQNYHFSNDKQQIITEHDNLLFYIDHALNSYTFMD